MASWLGVGMRGLQDHEIGVKGMHLKLSKSEFELRTQQLTFSCIKHDTTERIYLSSQNR